MSGRYRLFSPHLIRSRDDLNGLRIGTTDGIKTDVMHALCANMQWTNMRWTNMRPIRPRARRGLGKQFGIVITHLRQRHRSHRGKRLGELPHLSNVSGPKRHNILPPEQNMEEHRRECRVVTPKSDQH